MASLQPTAKAHRDDYVINGSKISSNGPRADFTTRVGRLRIQHTPHHERARMERGNFNVSLPLGDWLRHDAARVRDGDNEDGARVLTPQRARRARS